MAVEIPVHFKEINLLSVVFSFRNEADSLPELIRRVRNVLNSEIKQHHIHSYELIFVDDSSTDNSWDIIQSAALDHNDIKIIRTSRRFGPSPSPCVLAGMEHASGDVLVYMDADLQDPPELIPELIQAWRSDPEVEVVHTVRRSRKGESKLKLMITKLGYQILHKVTHFKLPKEAGDFKLLSRRVVNHLIQLREKKPFLRGLVCWVGFKSAFVTYDRDARFTGDTKFPVLSLNVINNFLESALISFSSTPLRLSMLLGFLTIMVGMGLLLYVIFAKIQGTAIPGWAGIMITVIFLNSIQLLCIGIMGLYVSSIFEETKNRPNYIIEKKFGFSDQITIHCKQEKPSAIAVRFDA